MDEVRRDDVRQGATLVVRLAYEADVAETEVAEAAVDQLRGRARGRPAEVALIDERHGETDPRSVGRDPRADDPAADDEQVELALAELRERALTSHVENGPLHAVPPAGVGDLDARVRSARRDRQDGADDQPVVVHLGRPRRGGGTRAARR